MKEAELKDLIGKTMANVENVNDEEIVFTTAEGERFSLYHSQNCCESVTVEDVVGNLSDLVGEPILVAEEATSDKNPEGVTKKHQDCFTWTFYKFATRKGYVDIRWYGESNGNYSESVEFKRHNVENNRTSRDSGEQEFVKKTCGKDQRAKGNNVIWMKLKPWMTLDHCPECKHRTSQHDMNCIECCPVAKGEVTPNV